MIFYLSSYSDFFYLTFLIIGSQIIIISKLGLLYMSLQPNKCADSLRRLILRCSSLSIILLHPIRADGFPFPFIYGPPYQFFQFHVIQLLFDFFQALLFCEWHISPSYPLPQLQGMEYT